MAQPSVILGMLELRVLRDLVKNPPSVVRKRLMERGSDPDVVYGNICAAFDVTTLMAAALRAYQCGLVSDDDINAAAPKQTRPPLLTERQICALRGRYENKSYEEIGVLLGTTIYGVSNLIARAQQAFGVTRREYAVQLGHELGYY